MWKSRDLTLVIITAVVVFVFTVSVFQVAGMITGILGANYIFTVGMAFLLSITCLLFEGRRWRFFLHNTIAALLTLPTALGGSPYDVFPRLVIILAGFQADIILNSFYGSFKKKNRLSWWSMLTGVEFFLVLPFLQILIFPLFFPPQFVAGFTNVVVIMLPWIIGGAVVGGFLGYKLYKRNLQSI